VAVSVGPGVTASEWNRPQPRGPAQAAAGRAVAAARAVPVWLEFSERSVSERLRDSEGGKDGGGKEGRRFGK
jgi:hypothetical protein